MYIVKTKLLFLISFLACHTIFAQTGPGIAVQGIARDAEKAALVDEPLTFTFDIQNSGGTSYYEENVNIMTDPYGVFSHIIGTGNVVGGKNFNEIPFGQTHMKLVISVHYNGADIILSNAPFQYAPYAKSAENGVPTGTIVAFAGAEVNIPKGWVLCDGRSLTTIANSQNLIDLIGDNTPNLQGMFLRGTGPNPVNGEEGPALGGNQDDGFESHLHDKGTLDVPAGTGGHNHSTNFKYDWSSANGDSGDSRRYGDDDSDGTHTVAANGGGGHDHSITGSTGTIGIAETRPVSYGVNYIIKL